MENHNLLTTQNKENPQGSTGHQSNFTTVLPTNSDFATSSEQISQQAEHEQLIERLKYLQRENSLLQEEIAFHKQKIAVLQDHAFYFFTKLVKLESSQVCQNDIIQN